jgi:predicted small integral membrane protein
MDLKGIGWVGLNWIDLVENRNIWWAVVNMVMNLQIP